MQAEQIAPKRLPAHRERLFRAFLVSLSFGVMTGNFIQYVRFSKGFYELRFLVELI